MISLPKPGNDPRFPQNLLPVSQLSTRANFSKKLLLNIIQRHIAGRNLLNASQFECLANHSTTLQCVRLIYHVTQNFNSKMSTAAVFLNIKNAFDTV
jgi:hypothetical protein